ncbi:unnamed protein product [Brachionus calyciflorus]|uniref:Uncharacterized protein n=1 Tax=Brachionus calyciflorus TaxID=104777 RepID=A0A814N6J5_9BILA|nr:unnamed protein product [Brachionus calyciflorus]
MGFFKDSTLQIFLTIYHGSLIATFFFDYIVRNSVRWITSGLEWNYITNVILGIIFVAIIIWAIMSVWSRHRRNLLISLVVLIIILVIRLGFGIPDTIDKHKKHGNSSYFKEELVVFIVQILVHLFGIAATWMLANN